MRYIDEKLIDTQDNSHNYTYALVNEEKEKLLESEGYYFTDPDLYIAAYSKILALKPGDVIHLERYFDSPLIIMGVNGEKVRAIIPFKHTVEGKDIMAYRQIDINFSVIASSFPGATFCPREEGIKLGKALYKAISEAGLLTDDGDKDEDLAAAIVAMMSMPKEVFN